MKQDVVCGRANVSEAFLSDNINIIMSLFKENRIGYRDLIICKADTHIGTYIQWLACEKAGVVPIFVASEYSINNVKLLNENIGATVILESKGTNHYIHVILNRKEEVEFLKDIKEDSIIHLTSATTGNPKLVLRTREQLDAEITRYSKYLEIDERDTILPIVPLYHSFGFISGMLLSRKVNAKIVLPEIILPRNIIQLSNENNVTMMLGAAYFYRKMINVSDRYTLNKELRYAIASGGPMEEGLQRDFYERFEVKLLQQYGSTETGSLCIGASENYKCVGKPIPGVGVKIINDESDRPCLYVSTSNTIGTYVTKSSVKKLDGNLYKMGDLASINGDGEVEIIGRCDDILVVNGKKVDRKAVIEVIKKMDDVDDADVFLNKYNDATELTCEYCSSRKVDKGIFVEYLREFLAEYQIPRRYIKVDNLKKNLKKSWKNGRI